jgi:hypothetical protein
MVGDPLTKDIMLTRPLISQLFGDIYFLSQRLQILEGVIGLLGRNKLLQLSYLLGFVLAKWSFIFFIVSILLHLRARHVTFI